MAGRGGCSIWDSTGRGDAMCSAGGGDGTPRGVGALGSSIDVSWAWTRLEATVIELPGVKGRGR